MSWGGQNGRGGIPRNARVASPARGVFARGSRVAPVTVAMAVLAFSVGSGCIAPDTQFAVPKNYPPSIESSPTADHPLTSIIRLDGPSEGDAGPTSTIVDLAVIVRDPNVNDVVLGFLFVGEQPPTSSPEVPVSGEVARAPFTFSFDSTNLPDGCHRIELWVSRALCTAPTRPCTEGDLGTAVWWAFKGENVDISSCPAGSQPSL